MTVFNASTARTLLPVSQFQLRNLVAAEDPATADGFHEYMTLNLAFRVFPKVSPRRLQRAFDTMVARHESLRLRFVKSKDGWKAEILPKHQRGVQVFDLTKQDLAKQDKTIRDHAGQFKTALSGSLFDLLLFRCGQGGDVVLISVHHSVSDGRSLILIMEDLVRGVLNLPLGGTPPGHADFVRHRQKSSEQLQESDAFWNDRLLPPPPNPNIGRRAKKLEAMSPRTMFRTTRRGAIFSTEESRRLHARAKAIGMSGFSLLHAAFSETLCKMSEQTDIVITSILGRHDANLSRFVGPAMDIFYLKYHSDPGRLDERAAWVAQEIAQVSQHLPTSAFSPTSAVYAEYEKIGAPLRRFRVHIENPVGHRPDSIFNRFFDQGGTEKLSLGFLSVQQFCLPKKPVETSFELDLLVHQSDDGPNATLVADVEAFSESEVLEVVNGVRAQLDF